jgi:hypothetical protein
MPKGDDTIIEEEPLNQDLEEARPSEGRPSIVRKSGETVPGRGSAAIEGYGVRDGHISDED